VTVKLINSKQEQGRYGLNHQKGVVSYAISRLHYDLSIKITPHIMGGAKPCKSSICYQLYQWKEQL